MICSLPRLVGFILCFLTAGATAEQSLADSAMAYLGKLTDPAQGGGSRVASSKDEQATAKWLMQQFSDMGYQPQEASFTYTANVKKPKQTSSNIIVDKPGRSQQIIVVGAHYDSTAVKKGSFGVTDNGAGMAVLLALAQALKDSETLDYSVRFIAFGAEEVGMQGSRAYVDTLSEDDVAQIRAMINLDTVAGGDYLYIHSAHLKPYQCDGTHKNYTATTRLRDALIKATALDRGAGPKHRIHPSFPGYPEGVTGPWSDHFAFACAGVPVAYIEATNFMIAGIEGNDGYSQTVEPQLWDCFDSVKMTACDPEKESKWGQIWHTGNDQLEKLQALFPGRIALQLQANIQLLHTFLTEPDRYW